jgi:CMP/dCMP kinase
MDKKTFQVAIDSPAGSGAGTQAKLISKYYKLFYLDTGKLYRILGYTYLKNKKKIDYKNFKKIILKTKFSDLKKKYLLKNEIGLAASYLAKKKTIRSFVTLYQKKIANMPPYGFKGVCFDGRDITYNIMPKADVKFFMTAKIAVRAKRRHKELISQGHNISLVQVHNTIKKRDESDFKRKISPLKKTRDSILIDNTNLTINQCFKKMKIFINQKIKKYEKKN